MGSAGSGNLPHPLTPLIGRRRELEEIGALLANSDVRLLTLVGPGGVGKTRLALCAAEMAERRFADGVRLVDLAPLTDPALVPAAIAQTLGMSTTERPVEEALIEYLLAWNLLLLLDNFEHVLEGAALVSRLLAVCSEVTVLATSREKLSVYGEHVYRVDPLDLPSSDHTSTADEIAGSDAVHLFLERAKASQTDFALTDANAEDVAAICTHLDGLPLAIELAAARVDLLSPKAMRARLEETLPLLRGRSRDRPLRHQTMRNAIAWTHDQLSDVEQALFRRLSVFVGGCSLEGVEAISGCRDSDAMLETMSSLLDKGLLRRSVGPDGEPRFVMLETLRQFGAERLRAHEEAESVRWAHAGYFLRLVEAAEPDLKASRYARWNDVLDVETANIRSAIQWSISQGDAGSETALRIGKAIWWYWKTRGRLSEARLWLQRSVDLGADSGSLLLAGAMLVLGHSLLHGDVTLAGAYYRRSLDLYQRLGDRLGEASSLRGLGMAAFDAANYNDAERLLRQALPIYREIDDGAGSALATFYLASIESKRANYANAIRLFHDALVEWRKLNSMSNVVYALIELARLERIQGNGDTARAFLTQAGDLISQAGTTEAEGYILLELGQISFHQENFQDALDHFSQALKSFHQFGYRDSSTAAAIEGIARLALTQSQWVESVRLAAAADAWREMSQIKITPADRRVIEKSLGIARQKLGANRFDAEWLIGTTLSFDDAIAMALSITIDPTAAPVAPPKQLPADLRRLSPRERQVLCLVARGRKDREVAVELGIAVRTVTTLMTRVQDKLDDPHNRTSAAAYAVAHGLCDLSHVGL